MQIDWVTVSAQIVNFLILIWLLRQFLYRRVIDAMDRRESRISARLEEAAQREQEAEEEVNAYRSRRQEFEDAQERMLADAREAAREEKQSLLEKLRREVDESRSEWQRQVRREREAFLAELRRESAHAVASIARKALTDLADAGLEEQVIHKLLAQLEQMDARERQLLAEEGGPIRVLTAHEPDANLKRQLTRAVHERIGEDLEVDYERSDELVCGVALVGASRRLGWNVGDYLDELSGRVDRAFSAVRGGEGDEADGGAAGAREGADAADDAGTEADEDAGDDARAGVDAGPGDGPGKG